MENKNNKKFKINLAKKIRNLTMEQKQGIKNIIIIINNNIINIIKNIF